MTSSEGSPEKVGSIEGPDICVVLFIEHLSFLWDTYEGGTGDVRCE